MPWRTALQLNETIAGPDCWLEKNLSGPFTVKNMFEFRFAKSTDAVLVALTFVGNLDTLQY